MAHHPYVRSVDAEFGSGKAVSLPAPRLMRADALRIMLAILIFP